MARWSYYVLTKEVCNRRKEWASIMGSVIELKGDHGVIIRISSGRIRKRLNICRLRRYSRVKMKNEVVSPVFFH